MIRYFVILLIMTFMGSIASLFLKKASGANGLLEMLKNVNLYIGGGLYLTSAVLNIWVLRYLDYSVVLPLTSFTYIWTCLLYTSWKRLIPVPCLPIGAFLDAGISAGQMNF